MLMLLSVVFGVFVFALGIALALAYLFFRDGY